MSCLNITIKRLSESLNLIVQRIGGIAVEINRYDKPIVATATEASRHLKVVCGIVCSVADLHYLRVSPHEVQWITPDEAIVYMVESDTNWTIITS